MQGVAKARVVRRILMYLRDLVQDVPAELEICEFHCTQPDCCRADWEGCPLRNARSVSLN